MAGRLTHTTHDFGVTLLVAQPLSLAPLLPLGLSCALPRLMLGDPSLLLDQTHARLAIRRGGDRDGSNGMGGCVVHSGETRVGLRI